MNKSDRVFRVVVIVYWLTLVIFTSSAIYYLVCGLRNLDTLTPASNLITIGITVMAGSLAIFFTVAAAVLASLTTKYSPALLRLVTGHFVFRLSLVTMMILVIANLLFLRYGTNPDFETLSLVASIYIVLDIALLVYIVAYFLDLTKILPLASAKARDRIESIPRSMEPGIRSCGGRRKPAVLIVRRVGSFAGRLLSWPLRRTGRIRMSNSGSTTLEVIRSGLQDDMRPIMSTCMKAIIDDNRELALSCLDEIALVSCDYLERSSPLDGMEDSFVAFIYSQLEIMFNTATAVYNQQYTVDIVNVISKLGHKSVELNPEAIKADINNLADVWAGLLQHVARKSLHLKHTAAPRDAILHVGSMGSQLIKKGVYTTAVFGMAEQLKEIGIITGQVGGTWPAMICRAAVVGFLRMILAIFERVTAGIPVSGMHVSKLCEDMEAATGAADKSRSGIIGLQIIGAPIVGSLWKDIKLTTIAKDALQHRDIDAGLEVSEVKALSRLAESLRRIGVGMISKAPAYGYEYFMAFSEFAYSAVQYVVDLEKRPTRKRDLEAAAETLLKAIAVESTDLLKVVVSDAVWVNSALFHLSPVPAFLTYYSKDAGEGSIYRVRNTYIERLATIYEDAKSDASSAQHAKKATYKYLKLVGAWIHKYSNQDPLNKQIVKVLARDYPEGASGNGYSEMDELGFPVEHPGDTWYLYPSEIWSPEQIIITRELNDLDNYRAYDELIRQVRGKA